MTAATQRQTANLLDRQLVARALSGDRHATDRLLAQLTPTVHSRVGMVLLKRRAQLRGRPLRQETEDLVQEVFVELFQAQGRVLLSWQPERGLTLKSFVGLVAERLASRILRTGKRSPFTEDPSDAAQIEKQLNDVASAPCSGAIRVESREVLRALRDRLQESLSPQGFKYFELLYVEGQTTEEVAQATGASRDAIYAWRSRLGRQARAAYEQLNKERPAEPVALHQGSHERAR